MKGLSLLQYYIKFSSNKLRNHSINEQCQAFFAGLLNRMYDLELVTLEKDHPAIDLGDYKNHYSVQITTDATKKNTIIL
ncbi:SMEK domain-containing protein [Paenibacillus amylolyticus]|uniref:SMEK domain-containing protein n=1 Tax=Paenibacillus amylolyticus TaxID=1451 RepID=UPI00339669C8